MSDFFSRRFNAIGDFWQSQHFVLVDLKNLISWDYWTEANLDAASPEYLAAIISLIILIGLLIFWRWRLKKLQLIAPVYQSGIDQLVNVIVFIIIVSISYIFFRSEAINYLSSRLVVLLAAVIVIGWLAVIGFYQLRVTPTKAREYLERERFFRYIPKSKQKSPPKKITNA